MTRREQGWNLRGQGDDLWHLKTCPRDGPVYVRLELLVLEIAADRALQIHKYNHWRATTRPTP